MTIMWGLARNCFAPKFVIQNGASISKVMFKQNKLYSTETTMHEKWKPKLVVFDKNGTLINFNSPWVPWAKNFANRVEDISGLQIMDQLLAHLNICLFTNRVGSGVLASGTSIQVKAHVRAFLGMKGISNDIASDIIAKSWEDCDTSHPSTLQEFTDLRHLFKQLTETGIKIAVCSSDNRRVTEKTMSSLGLIPYISLLSCGDDGSILPKPHASNIQHICSVLTVKPKDAVMVGDTEADMKMGVEAGVGMTIGVLSGVGTRLELVQYADMFAQDIQAALPLILDPPVVVTRRGVEKVRKPEESNKAQAVIFDKDGTLVCFHSMWTPWAKKLVESMEEETGLELRDALFKELGYCTAQQKWVPGLFAEGTVQQNKDSALSILEQRGVDTKTAVEIVDDVWERTDVLFPHDQKNKTVVVFDSPVALFKVLKQNNIKVAICTADNRHATTQFLRSIEAEQYIDLLVCGDDVESIPKPSPNNANHICKQLNVDPERVIVVGDTLADLGMGRSAKLGATVAVLTGVGNVEHLQNHADHVVESIKDILPIVLPDQSRYTTW